MFVFLGPVGHRNKILRNVKDVKRKEIEDSIPDEFLCPITRELMSDPVIAAGTIIIVSLFHLTINSVSFQPASENSAQWCSG